MPKTSQREWWTTSDALRDVLVETGRASPPQRVFAVPDVHQGWPVLDNEQVRVGTVVRWEFGIEEAFLVVHRALRSTLYVPTSAIGAVHEGSVVLNVPRSWIGSLDWKSPPRTHNVAGEAGATMSGAAARPESGDRNRG